MGDRQTVTRTRQRKRTCERERDVIVERHHLTDRSGILELKNGFLLYAEHDDVLAPHTDLRVCNRIIRMGPDGEEIGESYSTCALLNCLHCIFDLEQVPIGRENGEGLTENDEDARLM